MKKFDCRNVQDCFDPSALKLDVDQLKNESTSNNIDEQKISENIEETVLDEEFSGENHDINEEYNQEVEEELLDIPTFLRRQAN